MALVPPVRIHERGADRANGLRDYVPQWVDREEDGSSGRMEEDTELEEGEAFEGGGSGSGSGDDDLERLSYLDTRLESVLGDCQKEFQGNLSTERLGSKYGGYGSFLPSTRRAAPVLGGPGPPPPPGSEPARPRPPEGHVGALRPRPSEAPKERARRGQGGGPVVPAADPNSWPKEREHKRKNVRSMNAIVKAAAAAAAAGATNSVKETVPAEKKGLTVRLQLPPKTGQGLDKQAQNSVYNKVFGSDHPSSPSDDDLEDDDRSGSEDNASPDLSPSGMIRALTTFEFPYGGLISPSIPPLVSEPVTERKEIFKQLMNTPASKPDGGPGSRKFMETLSKVVKETRPKSKEVVPPPEPIKVAPVSDSVKVVKKEGKEAGTNTLKLSYKHPVREDSTPGPHSKHSVEPKKKGKESSKEYPAQKEPKDKSKENREVHKEVRKETVAKVAGETGRDGPKESFKATVPPAKEQVKHGERDSLDILKNVVAGKPGKKVSKKGGKETTRAKDNEREKGVYRHPLPVQGDANGLLAPAPQAPYPPLVGSSSLEVAAQPSIVLDNWVECTQCNQWRLALPGVNVDVLPDNWQCQSMEWLPGLNSCKYTEETTTNAVYNYLGLQNPNTLPAVGLNGAGPLPSTLTSAIPPLDTALESRHLEQKPSKAQKQGSKKGVVKKVGGSTPKVSTPTVKKVDMVSTKNKNLVDVQPRERGPPLPTEDPGYQRVMADKQKFKEKEKEKLKRMRASEGEDPRPQKQAVREDDRSKVPGGVKRKKKVDTSDNEEAPVVKKAKGGDGKGRKMGVEMFVQSKVQSSDENTHSFHYGSDDAGISSRNVGRGTLPAPAQAQAPRKMKVTLSGNKEPKKKDDRQDVRGDERKRKENQKGVDVRCKSELFVKHESSDSDDDKHRRDDYRRNSRENETIRKVDNRGRNGYSEGKKRIKEEPESEYHNEKRRMVSKDLEATREYETGSSPKSQPEGMYDERRLDGDFRGKRLFDEVSGIARTYVQGSDGERADDSPQGQSPAPVVDLYPPQDDKRGRGSSSPSPLTASSSKHSFSAASSASGSKGPSPIESTVSSSPLRSQKVEAGAGRRRAAECVQGHEHNTTPDSRPTSNKRSPLSPLRSPSPKRSTDEQDTQSDRDGQQRQTHRDNYDRGGLHSPEPSSRFNNRETSSGRERYARSNSREGPADFRKFDGKSRGSGRDDDRHWEEGASRERRAGSASHFGNGDRGGSYDRHRDDRHRERDDRYDRRGEDRFRERDRDRERDRERPRDTWTSERGGDVREERGTRERSVHQRDDWGGRPSSRESRLDKQGGTNWREESRPGRDSSREGRERTEDGVAEKSNVDSRSRHVDDNAKDELPCHDEHEPVHGVQRDNSSHRYEKNEPTPHKDPKARLNLFSDRNGDRAAAGSSVRKEVEGAATRPGAEPLSVSLGVNSRSRPEGQLPGARKRGSPATDTRHVDESAKQGKEPKNGSEGSYPARQSAEAGHASNNPGHIARGSDGGSGSPTKKNHAALSSTLTKEAKSLKHSADRIKNEPGMEDESTNMYLQAGLKFLEGAHHQEAANDRPGDFSTSFRIYLDTANLCDYCSSAFEKKMDHAAAALSYMVAALARMRVLMFKSKEIHKDHVELHNAVKASTALGNQVAAMQTPPTGLASVPQPNRGSDKPGSSHPAPIIGESPSSSSASDVDNLNNHAALNEKLASNVSKGTALSPLPGTSLGNNEVLPSRLHTNYQRLLCNSSDVYRMLESWNKARVATAAYEAECAGDDTRQEAILAIRRVGEIGLLDDMDALVKQVRVALDAIGH
ncbi:hypothetical protein Mapa_014204 [Marchantia paleacea]|nr:hypothetical protein Mapa_014204 [Marchantia paleacea]